MKLSWTQRQLLDELALEPGRFLLQSPGRVDVSWERDPRLRRPTATTVDKLRRVGALAISIDPETSFTRYDLTDIARSIREGLS